MAKNDVVHKAFTELAPRYEEAMDRELGEFLGLGYREFVDRLVEATAIQEGDLVLDVATGTALIPRRVVDKIGASGRVVGLDITPAMLRQGRVNIETSGLTSCIHLVCASGTEMPFPPGVFDLVICGFGTHHMDVPQLLFEMRRVLKVTGKLVVCEAGAPTFWRSFWGKALLGILLPLITLIGPGARIQAEVEAFQNIRTAGEWHTILSEIGFSNIGVTQSQPRRPWYPCALAIRAVAERI